MPLPSSQSAWRRYLLFWRRDVQSDIDAELRFHFDARIAELTALGLTDAEARARAEEEFGDVGDVTARLRTIDERIVRRQRRGEWLDSLRQDARFAVRSLARTPGVTATIIATLALGLGVNAAMFSFLDQIYGRAPGGIAHPETLRRVWVERRFANVTGTVFWPGFDYLQYQAVRAALGRDARVALYQRPQQLRLTRGENAPRASVAYAGPGLFEMLGVRANVGRLFFDAAYVPGSGANDAVVSAAFWRAHLRADSAVIGKTVQLSNNSYTIVGIAPEGFNGLDLNTVDVWLPLGALSRGTDRWWESRRLNGLPFIIHTAPGVSERSIEARIMRALRDVDAASDRKVDTTAVARLGSIIEARGPGQKEQEIRIATRLAGVAAIVLLIACANVVNLLLARTVRRRREIAVRLALGISRARLIRLLVVESVILAVVAGAAAVLAAYWGGTLLRALLLPDIHWASSALHWRVLAFALVAALGAGVVAGLVPALQASSPDVAGSLKVGARDVGPTRVRLRGALVVIQAALSVMLLAGAALFVRSLHNVQSLNIGYDTQRLVFGEVRFYANDSSGKSSQLAGMRAVADRMQGVPGVERVALAGMRPMFGFSFLQYFTDREFPPGKAPMTTFSAVSPEYFATTGLRVMQGTNFPPVRGAAMPRVTVVNRAMVDAVWPGENGIGKCMRFERRDAPCYSVIGVVENARRDQVIEQEAAAQYYLPLDNMPERGWSQPSLIVRADPNASAAVVRELRRMLHDTWPTGEPSVIRMADFLAPEYRPWRLGATLFTIFGLLALVVAAVGIYSAVSYTVNQRTREFGIRVALGARVGDVLRQVIGEGLGPVVIGVVLGIALSLIAGRLIASLLYGIEPSNPLVMLVVSLILVGVAAMAALSPGWRAARVDPMTALRAD